MEENSNPTPVTKRLLNETAIKKHALKCSTQLRAGYFTRVGSDFIEAVQADAENLVREIRSRYRPTVHDVVEPDADTKFVSGNFIRLAEEVLNEVVPRIIQARVQRHPTCGCTLKR